METEINKLSAQGWSLKSNDLNKNIFNIVMERDISDEEVKKKQETEKNNSKRGFIILGVIILFIFIIGNYTSNTIKQVQKENQIAFDEKYKDVKVIIDASTVLSGDVKNATNLLGTPEKIDKQLKSGFSTWTNFYTKDNRNIDVTYNTKTNKIISIFSEGTDEEQLIRELGLNKTRNDFDITAVQNVDDTSKITGIKVMKKIDTVTARTCTKMYITNNAKNPSGVKFVGASAEYMGGNDYYVTGSFDGTNSFGGTVRTDFKCNITILNKDTCTSVADCKFN